jgi:hypothetical protein
MSPDAVAAMLTPHYDFVPGRREGIRMWDREGRVYINCHS